MRRLGASLRAAVRCQHHRHVPAVLLGGRLDVAVVGHIGAERLQQPVPELGPRLFAAAEHDGDLDLGPRFQEADDVTLLGLVVVGVDLRSQLLFLDDGLLLVLARLARLLGRLVLELAVVHDLADRRPGVWGYFDEIEIGVRGDAECIFDAHDAYLLTARSDQADFRYANALVDAGLSADVASLVVSCRRPNPTSTLLVRTEKPCSEQGPMPTSRGFHRLRACTEQASEMPVTGPPYP